ncbi:uncharacterized protein RJT21DRAFT_14153 [Scheffersomyces amazonensis]|uniref:uncharacterized protein n=1 Tax=Scheffersomyces amazonensis TaxID=1078765 RepID=UPI00315CEA19
MSYNGIGLQTARGSGTSGHVQKNLSTDSSAKGHYRSRKHKKELEEAKEKKIITELSKREAKAEIQNHSHKRKIDLRCMELRDKLEDEGEEESTIVEKIKQLRSELTEKYSNNNSKDQIDKGDQSGKERSTKEVPKYEPRYKDNNGEREVR